MPWVKNHPPLNIAEGAIGGPDGFDEGVQKHSHAALISVEELDVYGQPDVVVIRINPKNYCADAGRELRELFEEIATAFEDGTLYNK